jgi:hypothetical protein
MEVEMRIVCGTDLSAHAAKAADVAAAMAARSTERLMSRSTRPVLVIRE